MSIHSNLRALMVKHNIKNPDLAELLEINVSTLSRKMNGESDFTISEIEKIKEIFGLPYEQIFFNPEIRKMSKEVS